MLRRLRLLFHNGYLDRPREQAKPFLLGNNPFIYGIGNKGADLLKERFNIPRGKVDWTSKNREVKGIFLEHTLLTADFMVAMELACKSRGDIKLIEPAEIIAHAPLRQKKQVNPCSWKVKVKINNNSYEFQMIPDKVFGLKFLNEPEGNNKAFFLVEIDRATMPVVRTDLSQTSFYKKMIGYWASWQEGVFAQVFGFKNPRVLTITTTHGRIANMIQAGKAVDERKHGLRLFLFARREDYSLAEPQRLFEQVWLNGRGERASLLD